MFAAINVRCWLTLCHYLLTWSSQREFFTRILTEEVFDVNCTGGAFLIIIPLFEDLRCALRFISGRPEEGVAFHKEAL